MEIYQNAALAPSTRRVYQVGLRHYNHFCKALDIESFPVSQKGLSLFTTHLTRSVSYKTIKLYIAAIKFYNIELGFKDKVSQMQQLHILLRGIKRKLGSHGLHKPRLPITLPTMKILHSYLKESHLRHQDQDMLWAAFTLAFFAFLRSSEYVSKATTSYIPESTLLCSDISQSQQFITINIKASKTDPFREGMMLYVAKSGRSVCAVKAMYRYLRYRKKKKGPLFKFRDRTYLTRQTVTSTIRAALEYRGKEVKRYSSHSFRIGAASTAAEAGLPDSLIKSLGRWRSNCYQHYIRISTKRLKQVPKQLASVHRVSQTWVAQ